MTAKQLTSAAGSDQGGRTAQFGALLMTDVGAARERTSAFVPRD